MPRSIEELSEVELSRFIRNYQASDKSEGGIFQLSELLVERLRRTPTIKSPRDVFKFVVEAASAATDGQTTYQEVWGFLQPGEPWKGNHSIKVVGGTLGAVIAYCVQNELPIVSTLVVQSGNRKLSDRAVQNIYNDCKLYGVNVGPIAEKFVARETQRARELNLRDLP